MLPKANIYKFKSTMPLREVIGDINRYFRIYKTAFAFMGITACDEWMKLEALSQSPSQQTLTRWAPVQTTPQPKFEHWVWLSGPIQQVSIGYQFDFWTWRDKYSVQVRTNVMKDYIYGFIAGHVDMTFV
ncbi:MAG: hypothetical protein IPM54_35580 [Polyangiaceae bacterium]|nr:hypothetical protein [Polyangiaceae bacterium]